MFIGATITAATVAKYVGVSVILGGVTQGFRTIIAKKTINAYGEAKKFAEKLKNK